MQLDTYLDELSLQPDEAWDSHHARRVEVRELQVEPPGPQQAGTLRVVCVSDTHGFGDNLVVPHGDVLIHAGDFTNTGMPTDVAKFDSWLQQQTHKHKLVIAGNHDITFEPSFYIVNWDRYHKRMQDYSKVRKLLTHCTYLEDSGVVIGGYTFWGTPWQPAFGKWAFNLPRGKRLREKWELIPTDTDILISHGPPVGMGDLLYTGARSGCVDLLRTVTQRVKPMYHIFGHIHEGYGLYTDGTTKYANASTCTHRYRPTNPAVVFDLPILDQATMDTPRLIGAPPQHEY